MPIKPPNLDDRRYADIVAEARSLIPQYCPEWTNLNDADPGITLVQLFAWMTEMIVYRLNRVPDKTYIHFLNFIGEERRPALPAVAPVTFDQRAPGATEIPPFTLCATRQKEETRALPFLTVDGLTVHASSINRIMAVRGGRQPAVREIPFTHLMNHRSALAFGSGRGVQVFDLDPIDYGPDSYTPNQYLYLHHDDLRTMDQPLLAGHAAGRLRIRRKDVQISLVDLFDWEYPSEGTWKPVPTDAEAEEVLGMAEKVLLTNLPGLEPIDTLRLDLQDVAFPETVEGERWWIRGHLCYERWLAERMLEDLEIAWRDDRGGDERAINNWEVRASGRILEFNLADIPPVRGGWTIRFSMVDRSLPAGRDGYLPAYRWTYRRGEVWEPIPRERVRAEGPSVILTGPLTDMATDGFNLRAERIETVYLRGLCPDLELDLNWIRPVELSLFTGDDPRRLEALLVDEAPWSPFQIAPTVTPTINRKFYVGSDLFDNRPQLPVLVELEVAFEVNGEPVVEPEGDYLLQLTYRAQDNWRVVWSDDKRYAGFTFATLDPDGAKKAGRRVIRFVLDPATQLKGLARHEVGGCESAWIRFELVKSNLTFEDKAAKARYPVIPRIWGIRLGPDKTLGVGTFEQPMPGARVAQVDRRDANQRLTRILTRAAGRLAEFYPFFPFIELDQENVALYLHFDRPLPPASRHAIQFRCQGEAYLPEDVTVDWEVLERRDFGRTGWQRIRASTGPESKDDAGLYKLNRSGELSFRYPEPPPVPDEGYWIRARFNLPPHMMADRFPALPPLTHMFLNTVNAVNLATVRTERFSGHGVPNQVLQLRRKPIFLHPVEKERSPFPRPEAFEDVRLHVESDGGSREDWTAVREPEMLVAGKDDRFFVVDPVEGTLTFGNGIRGRMLPVGTNNVVVDVYRVVPGAQGNIGAGQITVAEGAGEAVRVLNLLPAVGGRDAESIEEIIRRAPSLLTSRNRAVTRNDFEIIATEASGEVARAACPGQMDVDGCVEVVILPRRRVGEEVPDPFLSVGLRDHVGAYLKRRCLINVEPVVRLARFRRIDVSVKLRLRTNANVLLVREQASAWVRRFLDPYTGGLDGAGWPFGGALFGQDLGRMVSEIVDVRHVSDVHLFDLEAISPVPDTPGWEQGEGTDVLVQAGHDLFHVRRVRVLTEDIVA
jgi:hypothetical protein